MPKRDATSLVNRKGKRGCILHLLKLKTPSVATYFSCLTVPSHVGIWHGSLSYSQISCYFKELDASLHHFYESSSHLWHFINLFIFYRMYSRGKILTLVVVKEWFYNVCLKWWLKTNIILKITCFIINIWLGESRINMLSRNNWNIFALSKVILQDKPGCVAQIISFKFLQPVQTL